MGITYLPSGSAVAGRFEIMRMAGSGDMGTVYKARDRLRGDAVALKIFHRETGSTDRNERFMHEAHPLSLLRHPAIVNYVAHGRTAEEGGQRFLVMEWLNGQDLAQRLSHGSLSLRDTFVVMERVAAGLAVAHQRGVVHRNIKPSNLFLRAGDPWRVVLLDFGIAEEVRGESDVGPAADIFDLGRILYQCLTGRPTVADEHLEALRAELPPPLADLVSRMLHRDPAQRPRDAGVLVDDLSALAPLISSASSLKPRVVPEISRPELDKASGEPIPPPKIEPVLERDPGSALLLRLDDMACRALQAASVFGETFWRGAVLELLGSEPDRIDRVLQGLIAADAIELHARSHYVGEREYHFRDGLLRDAAYGMLTDEERRHHHQLAARYLERVGEPEALIIADHYKAADLLPQALPFFIRASEQALKRNDLEGTLRRVEQGLACNAQEQDRGALRGLQLEALFALGRWQEMPAASRDAITLLPRGSRGWCRSMFLSSSLAAVGALDQFLDLARQIRETDPAPEAQVEYLRALANTLKLLSAGGIRADAQRCLERMLAIGSSLMTSDVLVRGHCSQAHSYYLRFLDADPWAVYMLNREAVAAAEQLADRRWLIVLLGEAGSSLMELGNWAQAEPPLRAAKDLAQELGDQYHVLHASTALLINLVRSGELAHQEEAHRIANELLLQSAGNNLMEGTIHTFEGQNFALSQQLDAAEIHLRRAIELMHAAPGQQLLAIAYLISVLLQKGQLQAAYALAHHGLSMVQLIGESGDALIRFLIAAAETCGAAGDVQTAIALLARARMQSELRANRIPDPEWRARFLTLPEHVRIAQLGVF